MRNRRVGILGVLKGVEFNSERVCEVGAIAEASSEVS